MCVVPDLKNGFIFSFLSLLIACLANSLQKWLEKIIFLYLIHIYNAGTAGFAFDEDRANSGYRAENCWYTTKDLINTGLTTYNTNTAGANMPLFHFVQRKDPEQQNAKSPVSYTHLVAWLG